MGSWHPLPQRLQAQGPERRQRSRRPALQRDPRRSGAADPSIASLSSAIRGRSLPLMIHRSWESESRKQAGRSPPGGSFVFFLRDGRLGRLPRRKIDGSDGSQWGVPNALSVADTAFKLGQDGIIHRAAVQPEPKRASQTNPNSKCAWRTRPFASHRVHLSAG